MRKPSLAPPADETKQKKAIPLCCQQMLTRPVRVAPVTTKVMPQNSANQTGLQKIQTVSKPWQRSKEERPKPVSNSSKKSRCAQTQRLGSDMAGPEDSQKPAQEPRSISFALTESGLDVLLFCNELLLSHEEPITVLEEHVSQAPEQRTQTLEKHSPPTEPVTDFQEQVSGGSPHWLFQSPKEREFCNEPLQTPKEVIQARQEQISRVSEENPQTSEKLFQSSQEFESCNEVLRSPKESVTVLKEQVSEESPQTSHASSKEHDFCNELFPTSQEPIQVCDEPQRSPKESTSVCEETPHASKDSPQISEERPLPFDSPNETNQLKEDNPPEEEPTPHDNCSETVICQTESKRPSLDPGQILERVHRLLEPRTDVHNHTRPDHVEEVVSGTEKGRPNHEHMKTSKSLFTIDSSAYLAQKLAHSKSDIDIQSPSSGKPEYQCDLTNIRTQAAVDTLIDRLTNPVNTETQPKESKTPFIPPFFRHKTEAKETTEKLEPMNDFERDLFVTRHKNKHKKISPRKEKKSTQPNTPPVVKSAVPAEMYPDDSPDLDMDFQIALAMAAEKEVTAKPRHSSKPNPVPFRPKSPTAHSKSERERHVKFEVKNLSELGLIDFKSDPSSDCPAIPAKPVAKPRKVSFTGELSSLEQIQFVSQPEKLPKVPERPSTVISFTYKPGNVDKLSFVNERQSLLDNIKATFRAISDARATTPNLLPDPAALDSAFIVSRNTFHRH